MHWLGLPRLLCLALAAPVLAAAPKGTNMPDSVPADRVVLDGVPRIGFHIRHCPFPGSVEAVLKYLGESPDYDWLMGVSGACFRRAFHCDDGGNVDLMYFSPRPQTHLFDALGYDFRAVYWDDKATMIAAIRQSISAGRPVIAFGIIGPPEVGIVAGHNKGGEALLGYSYFQDSKKFPGYYELAGWYEQVRNRPSSPDDPDLGPHGEVPALIVLGGRKEKPSERQVLIAALQWAIDLQRTERRPNLPNHVCGIAAYEAWARAMEIDAAYPKEDAKVLRTRVMVHGDQCVMVVERGNASRFLRKMAVGATEAADELNAAARLYDEIGACHGLWPWGEHHYESEQVQQGLADPATRKSLAKVVRQYRDAETKAVEHLERALAKLAPAPLVA